MTVTITVFEDRDGLDLTLRSLCAQTSDRFDVIVVDDGSRSAHPRIWHSESQTPMASKGTRALPCRARDTALSMTRAPFALICDAGIVLPPTLLHDLVSLQQQHGPCIIPVLLTGYDGVVETFTCLGLWNPEGLDPEYRDERERCFFQGLSASNGLLRDDDPDCWPGLWATLCYPRECGLECGGCDEDFDGYDWALEDIEFSYRLIKQGLPIVVSQKAYAIHVPHARDTAAIRKGLSQSSLLMLLKHPELPVEVYRYCLLSGQPISKYYEIVRMARSGQPGPTGSGHGTEHAVIGSGRVLLAGSPGRNTLEAFPHSTVISWCRENERKDYWLIGAQLPFPNKSFDWAIVDGSVQSVPIDQDSTRREMSRVAKSLIFGGLRYGSAES